MDYHKQVFKDSSFLIYKNNKLISLFPANIIDNKIYSHNGLTYGGLVLSKESKFKDVLNVLNVLLKELHENNIVSVTFKQTPSIYYLTPSEELNFILHKLNAKLLRRDLMSVIRISDYSLSKDRLNGFKRGLKHNLVVKEVSNFDDFWNILLVPNLKFKYGVSPVHTLTEITLLKSLFKNNIRQFNIYYNDNIIAGTTIFETKTTAHVQYTASNDLKNKTGSLDFLFYSLISDQFKNKLFFDFGISSNPKNGKLNDGLLYWKEGFGSRSVTQDFYELDTSGYKQINTFFDTKDFYDLLD